MREIPYDLAQNLGGEAPLRERVAAFRSALAIHRMTVDQPAPVEDPLVEMLARSEKDFAVSAPPEPIEPPPPPKPIRVSIFQMKAALLIKQANGRSALPQVDEYLTGLGGLAALAWQTATEAHRLSPLVLSVAEHFGWGEADLDDLFSVADGIKV